MKTTKEPSNVAHGIAELSFGAFFFGRSTLVLLAIACIHPANLQACPMDAPDAAPNLKPTPSNHEIEMEAQLDGVLKFDQEIAAREDMTAESINKASTTELLNHFLTSKMAVWLKLYDDPGMGVRRSLRGSRTLAEGFRRQDLPQAFLGWNQYLIALLNKMSPDNMIGKGISTRIMAGDILLQAPQVAKKWKGFEKPLLRVMCERYRAMNEANDRFSEAAKPFGASFNSMGAIIKILAAAIDPNGNWESGTASGGESDLVNRAERLVK